MNTKDKIFSVLNDVDKISKIIDKACGSQLEMFK